MPKLNINKIFGFDYHYDQDYDCEDWEYHCEDLPYRESFRAKQFRLQSWGLFEDRKQKINHINLGKIVDRIITNNIGKSFDETYSYYCKLIPKNTEDKHYEFMGCFEEPHPYYYVDSNGNIQNNNFWDKSRNREKQSSLTKRNYWESLDRIKKLRRENKINARNRKYSFKFESFLTKGVLSNQDPFHIVTS